MDKEIGRLIDNDTPKLNPLIANGFAVEEMRHVEAYVDEVFRSAARGFPEGLLYTGCTRCTPQEEFEELAKQKNSKRVFDVARSDLYMMKYQFRYKGVDLPPRYMQLPFVSDAGTIVLGGSRFTISPVLSDRVISVDFNDIFVRLLKARMTFQRMGQHYLIDGKRETVQVAWSAIYNRNPKIRKLKQTVKANCTLMHYLFCKYGFSETFRRYGKCQPVIGGAEINSHLYPESEWVICSSTRVPPKGVGKSFYQPSIVHIAVRKEEMTPVVRNMIGGFFYVADHFPTRVLPEYVDSTRMWMILLGHLIFTGTIGDGKLYSDIDDHMKSLDEYIDSLVLVKLKEIGIHITDVYDLFAIIIEHFNDWLLAAADKVASMYDKELSVLYYVFFEITSAIFKLGFKLKAASKKELTPKEIISLMNSTLKTGLIYSITKSNHGEVSTVSAPGDNKAFKATSILVPQWAANRQGGKKDRGAINDPSLRLHVSVAEIGGYSNLPKSEPSGRSRINPHVRVDSKRVVQKNPELAKILDPIQAQIRRE